MEYCHRPAFLSFHTAGFLQSSCLLMAGVQTAIPRGPFSVKVQPFLNMSFLYEWGHNQRTLGIQLSPSHETWVSLKLKPSILVKLGWVASIPKFYAGAKDVSTGPVLAGQAWSPWSLREGLLDYILFTLLPRRSSLHLESLHFAFRFSS